MSLCSLTNIDDRKDIVGYCSTNTLWGLYAFFMWLVSERYHFRNAFSISETDLFLCKFLQLITECNLEDQQNTDFVISWYADTLLSKGGRTLATLAKQHFNHKNRTH